MQVLDATIKNLKLDHDPDQLVTILTQLTNKYKLEVINKHIHDDDKLKKLRYTVRASKDTHKLIDFLKSLIDASLKRKEYMKVLEYCNELGDIYAKQKENDYALLYWSMGIKYMTKPKRVNERVLVGKVKVKVRELSKKTKLEN